MPIVSINISALTLYLLALTCSIPAIAGIVFWKIVEVKFRPFVYSLWLAVPVELVAIYSDGIKSRLLIAVDYDFFLTANIALFGFFT